MKIFNSREAGYSSYLDPRLQPPEYPEPEVLDAEEYEISLKISEIIEVFKNSDWEFKDDNYPFLADSESDDGEWRAEEGFVIVDSSDLLTDVYHLLTPYIPVIEREYKLNCSINLTYRLSNVTYQEVRGEEIYDTSDSRCELLESKCKISNLSVVDPMYDQVIYNKI